MRGVLLACVVLLALASSAAALSVRKEVAQSKGGLHTIRVAYRKANAPVTEVKLQDSLPDNLELVSGELSANLPPPTKEFQFHEYVVRAVDVDFTLANRTHDITLPSASFTFVKEDGEKGSQRTHTVVLTVTGPNVPQGDFEQPLLVLLLTIALPVVAAYIVVGSVAQSGRAAASAKKRK